MSSKTKIVVLRMKELIYTAIFIGLAILLITLFFIMFRPKGQAEASSGAAVAEEADGSAASYIPGIYSASLVLGSQQANVEVTVSADRICSVTCTPASEAVETLYPLMVPTAEELESQICESQSLENLTIPEGSQYTARALLEAVSLALEKAAR